MFKLMKQQGVAPDSATFLALLEGYAAAASFLATSQAGPSVRSGSCVPCTRARDRGPDGTGLGSHKNQRSLGPTLPSANAVKGRVLALLKQMSSMGVKKDGSVYAKCLQILANLGATKEILAVTAAMREDDLAGGGHKDSGDANVGGEGRGMVLENGREDACKAQGTQWQSNG